TFIQRPKITDTAHLLAQGTVRSARQGGPSIGPLVRGFLWGGNLSGLTPVVKRRYCAPARAALPRPPGWRHMNNIQTTVPTTTTHTERAGPILTYGVATGLGVGVVWYITHLPWLELSQQAALPVILVTWLVGAIAAGQAGGKSLGWLIGLGSGLVACAPGLLL